MCWLACSPSLRVPPGLAPARRASHAAHCRLRAASPPSAVPHFDGAARGRGVSFPLPRFARALWQGSSRGERRHVPRRLAGAGHRRPLPPPPLPRSMNCADNTGAKNLYIIAVGAIGARLNRCVAAQPTLCVGGRALRCGPPACRRTRGLRRSTLRRAAAARVLPFAALRRLPLLACPRPLSLQPARRVRGRLCAGLGEEGQAGAAQEGCVARSRRRAALLARARAHTGNAFTAPSRRARCAPPPSLHLALAPLFSRRPQCTRPLSCASASRGGGRTASLSTLRITCVGDCGAASLARCRAPYRRTAACDPPTARLVPLPSRTNCLCRRA